MEQQALSGSDFVHNVQEFWQLMWNLSEIFGLSQVLSITSNSDKDSSQKWKQDNF